jgi:hypothetical protein
VPESYDIPDIAGDAAKRSLGPGGTTHAAVEMEGGPEIDDALMIKLRDPKSGCAIRVFGLVTYRDAFGIERQTSWRAHTKWDGQEFLLGADAEGNQET